MVKRDQGGGRFRRGGGFVFPVGDEPCDEAWTGFQSHNPERGSGYVLLFRELHNRQRERTVPLHFVDGEPLAWHDLLSGERWRGTGGLTCGMDPAPAFRWLRYESA